MVKEFVDFLKRGNVLDLAVAVIIGGAFGKIVTSLVNDIIMPVVSLATGGISFADLYIDLSRGQAAGMSLAQAQEAGLATLNYGLFINNIIDFVIIALVIFMMIRTVNKMKKKEEAAQAPPPAPSAEEKLLTEIRDLLKSGR